MESHFYITEKGRITSCQGGLYAVWLDSGKELKCRARGNFRYKNTSPLPGDIATVRYAADKEGNIVTYEKDGVLLAADAVLEEISPRLNALIRPPMANLEYMFVTMAAASPEPDLHTIDKMLCIAEHNKIEPVIVIGKAELSPENASRIKEIYEKAGFKVFVLSCYTGDGVEELSHFVMDLLPGRLMAFAGASGVGKSTLMNRIFPGLLLETSDISRKIERGRHTTRKVEVFRFYDRYIADTPGFSMLDFEHFHFFDKECLVDTFREFREHIGYCRYTKCTHTKEDGCAILEAVKDGSIPKSRHDSFLTLYGIMKNQNSWDKK